MDFNWRRCAYLCANRPGLLLILSFDPYRAGDVLLVLVNVLLAALWYLGSFSGGPLDSDALFVASACGWRVAATVVPARQLKHPVAPPTALASSFRDLDCKSFHPRKSQTKRAQCENPARLPRAVPPSSRSAASRAPRRVTTPPPPTPNRLGLVLRGQERTQFWTRHFERLGLSAEEAFENWKRIWNTRDRRLPHTGSPHTGTSQVILGKF